MLHRQSDEHTVKVQLKLTRLNFNAVGTHFGGSLYAMCDPFFMLILMHHLGRDYVVWDKAATIQFLKPGRGTVTAMFCISPEIIDDIRAQVEREGKVEPVFQVDVIDEAGLVVAHVEKRLYVRKKAA